MEGGGGLGEDDLQKHIVFRFAGLMEHWEWAHALPKPADAVFKNLWGDFMTPSLGVEWGGSHDPVTPVTWFDALIQSTERKYLYNSHTSSCLCDTARHTATQSSGTKLMWWETEAPRLSLAQGCCPVSQATRLTFTGGMQKAELVIEFQYQGNPERRTSNKKGCKPNTGVPRFKQIQYIQI